MVNFYVGKNNIPIDKYFVFDVERVFPRVIISGTPFQKLVLQEIEKGQYYSESMFRDRFGGCLYYDALSTGSKALLLTDYLKDSIINFDEVGDNAIAYLSCAESCNVYMSRRGIDIPWMKDSPATFNGVAYDSISSLNRSIW